MFADAIEIAESYTRSVHFIMRNYKSTEVIPGTATLFFVNDEGVAVTCKHVADELLKCNGICESYRQFKEDVAKVPNDAKRKAAIKRIEQNRGFNSQITAQSKSMFFSCAEVDDQSISFTAHRHPEYDLAIIRINNAKSYQYTGHAVFAKDSSKLRRGDYLCRIGYPFPEFTNFKYNPDNDDIEWTGEGRNDTPLFPIEGMFTRRVTGNHGELCAYELSAPGLRGQSGGPLFDINGIVYGMQFQTMHFPLGFDQNGVQVRVNGQMKAVDDHPFLHVGRCINVDTIKKFLDENQVKYYVGDSIDNEEVVNGD